MENDSAMPQNARKMTKQDTKEMLRFFDSWHEHRDDFSPDADVLNFAFAWASRGAPLPPPPPIRDAQQFLDEYERKFRKNRKRNMQWRDIAEMLEVYALAESAPQEAGALRIALQRFVDSHLVTSPHGRIIECKCGPCKQALEALVPLEETKKEPGYILGGK